MTSADIDCIVLAYRSAAERALAAGYDAIEIHSAHGYLLHEFLSPLSNQRKDDTAARWQIERWLLLRIAPIRCARSCPNKCRCSSASLAATGPKEY